MKLINLILFFIVSMLMGSSLYAGSCDGVLDVEKKYLASDEQVRLCDVYQNKVVLIVNTASKCGYTHQYEGLEQLYRDYQSQGLVVLGFPSNDFGGQEPGTEQQIQRFCRLTYSIQFPMFEKTHVDESSSDPLFKALREEAGEAPGWNFHKYLINRDGELVGSFSSRIEPLSREITDAIERVL